MTAKEHADTLRNIADTKAKKLPNSMIADLRSAADYVEALHQSNVNMVHTIVQSLAAVGIKVGEPSAQAKLDAAGKLASEAIRIEFEAVQKRLAEVEAAMPKDQRELLSALRSAQTNYASLKSAYDVLQRENERRQPCIPHSAVCFFKDGDRMCAVFGDFKNQMESPAGFGRGFEEALAQLNKIHIDRKADCEFSDARIEMI